MIVWAMLSWVNVSNWINRNKSFFHRRAPVGHSSVLTFCPVMSLGLFYLKEWTAFFMQFSSSKVSVGTEVFFFRNPGGEIRRKLQQHYGERCGIISLSVSGDVFFYMGREEDRCCRAKLFELNCHCMILDAGSSK